jgi:NtrC-family two-component system sensor histidine kinase KinB
MQPTLRLRILLTLVPLLVLLIILGVAAMLLLHRLGERIDAIIHENYDSVVFMEHLNEAVERIDSSFSFALAGEAERARVQYRKNWEIFNENLHREQHNVTLPGEQELVDELTDLAQVYRKAGDAFYRLRQGPARKTAYFDGGLYGNFQKIKDVATRINDLNKNNMVQASNDARRTARESRIWFGIGLAVAVLVAGLLAWRTLRSLLGPIQAITESALNIGAGNLDQVVPVLSRDELGQLAEAFNTMARQLRGYRQTNYARLIRAQQTSQATIDSFPDPVLVVDSESHVEMANPAARRLLGVDSDKPGERSATPWNPPEPLRQPLAEALREQRAYLPEGFDRLVRFGTGGQDHSFLPRILPIRDPYGGTLGAAVLLQDVTRFRLLDEVKSDLVATVSHELKTPLTSVRLAVHLLLEETIGPLTAKQTELLLDARDNAERLLARVNNLLDLARLEQGRAQLQTMPLPPADLLRSAAETVRPRAEDKGVELVVEAADNLPPLAADAGRLGHALDNLLDNALRFTERGGRITLSAAPADGSVTLIVADTGLGIPEEYLPRIFDKFFRIPGRTAGSGTGLGLAIVREIVTAHGGQVACTSHPGSGTEFRLTLPVWQDGRPAQDAKGG